MSAQVVPSLPKPVDTAALRSQTEGEARRDMEASAGFSGRAQQWQQEYRRDSSAAQAEGGIRLTAAGEDGLHRPCCSFVKPLQLGRSAVCVCVCVCVSECATLGVLIVWCKAR